MFLIEERARPPRLTIAFANFPGWLRGIIEMEQKRDHGQDQHKSGVNLKGV